MNSDSAFSLSTDIFERAHSGHPAAWTQTLRNSTKGVEIVRDERRIIGLFLLIAVVGLHLFASQAFAQKATKETVSFGPPTVSLAADPKVITVCDGEGNMPAAVVHLIANAICPSGGPIGYRWSASAGHIEGNGPTVTWDLSGVSPGYYKAFLDIDTGSGTERCQAFTSTTVLVSKCPPPRPVCPNTVISCSENPVAGEPLDFRASVTGGTPNVSGIYNWTVSAGTIIAGQGTNSIRVDTTGLAGQSVTATLSIGGYHLDCPATCVVQFPVPIECRKFDEFPDIARNDEKARLDNYAIELQNDPTSTAYVIVYPGAGGRPGDLQKHTSRIVDYLLNSRGVDGSRIVTLVGPPRANLFVDLWACPQGSKPPTPNP